MEGDAALGEPNATPAVEPARPGGKSSRGSGRAALWLAGLLILILAGVALSPFWAPQIEPLLPWGENRDDYAALAARVSAVEARPVAPSKGNRRRAIGGERSAPSRHGAPIRSPPIARRRSSLARGNGARLDRRNPRGKRRVAVLTPKVRAALFAAPKKATGPRRRGSGSANPRATARRDQIHAKFTAGPRRFDRRVAFGSPSAASPSHRALFALPF